MADLEQDLAQSDSIAETQLLKPTVSEVSAIKEQCTLVLEKRALLQSHKELTKPFRDAVSSAKQDLVESFKALEDKLVTLSKTKLKECELDCAKEGFCSLPLYVRIQVTNKDIPIKQEFLEEALSSVGPEDIDELKAQDKEAGVTRSFRELLQESILRKIRHNVRTSSESIKLTNSLERGRKFHEVTEMDDFAEKMLLWHLNDQRLKKHREEHADNLKELSAKIKEKEGEIQNFFERTQTTSQKLVLEEKPQRLVRRTTTKKSRVGLNTIGPWVQSCLDSLEIQTFRSFQKNQSHLLKDLADKLETQPVETKTSVSLVASKSTS